MDESRELRAELRVSPKPVLLSLVISGLVLALAGALKPNFEGQAHMQVLALLAYAFAGVGALLHTRTAWAARWFVVIALVAVIILADIWLGTPEVLALMLIPTGLAAALIGLPAAFATALGETAVLLMLGRAAHQGAGQASVSVALIATWAMVGLLVAIYRPVIQLARSYGEYYERALGWVKEARDRRAELEQTLADLAEANLQLTRLNAVAQGLRQLADEARRAKEEFVSNVSHELRTPLNMVIGFTELILQAPESYGSAIPPALLADLAVIERNAEHLSQLIDDVLDLSQVDVGQMALTKEYVPFEEIVEGAATVVRPLFDSKGLCLEAEVQENIPPVLCDRTRIREVLVNLLSNAGRFTEQGGVRVHVWQEANDLLVTVADTGLGIAPGDQERLFRPFQQLDSSVRRRYGGSGLGLSISKRFIELHEGSIWVDSEEGLGTTFSFRLPVVPASPGASGPSRWLMPQWEYRERTRSSNTPEIIARPRFVVLESGTSLQRLMVRYLDGAEIVPVTSVEEALSELEVTPSQALLVNAASPAQAVRQLAQDKLLPAGVPVIVCSVPGVEQAASALRISDYLVKPVSREDLLAALDRLELSSGTILIVDDEPDAVRLFRRMLVSAGRGYRVVRAGDGQEALDVLSEDKVDVILLDLVMPNLDGFQLLELRGTHPALRDIPVVVVSARDPVGHPIVSNALTVTQAGGLSVHHLLGFIEAATGLLSPAGPRAGRVPQAATAG